MSVASIKQRSVAFGYPDSSLPNPITRCT